MGVKDRMASEAEKGRGLAGEEQKRKRKVNGMETKQERGRQEKRQGRKRPATRETARGKERLRNRKPQVTKQRQVPSTQLLEEEQQWGHSEAG